MTDKPIVFGILGADQNHIFGMTAGMLDAGATLKGWWTRDEPTNVPPSTMGPHLFSDKPFPMAPRVSDHRQLLEDPEIDVMLVCAIPSDRAALSVAAMKHGKDVMSDKPGAVTVEEMAAIRKAMDETGRIWTVNFSERTNVRCMERATDLVRDGLIGQVVQVISVGPHNELGQPTTPWGTDAKQSGGIINFLGSHQFDHFLHFTGSTEAEVVASTIGNFKYPNMPDFDDFGEALVRGNKGVGYIQVSRYNPNGQRKVHPGDIRTLIIGTEGQVECRKYVDIGGRPGKDHLFLMNDTRSERIDCSDVKLKFFDRFINDLRERSWTHQPREQSLLASELAIKAQLHAARVGNLTHA